MEELVKEAKRGDPQAFTQLIQQQMQSMYKTARALLRNDEDVADAISETVLTCWEKIGQLNYERYFRTWMTRILVNKCNDILRKKVNLFYTDAIPEKSAHDSRYENVEWREALNSLGEKYRLVILLYYVEGFKTSEISKILEIPESTVRSRLVKGRKDLADEYNSDRRETV